MASRRQQRYAEPHQRFSEPRYAEPHQRFSEPRYSRSPSRRYSPPPPPPEVVGRSFIQIGHPNAREAAQYYVTYLGAERIVERVHVHEESFNQGVYKNSFVSVVLRIGGQTMEVTDAHQGPQGFIGRRRITHQIGREPQQ
ncbi:unnamed protein product [Vicia faba]|uniref:VOC domain-containing protein n=1 Tax=Vicia faba TaxID=3906 RepID=A0AAV0YI73_VICFA|nr:unnamed protein product [Vicia faba]